MKYKNYIAIIDFDDDANIFHGEIANIRDVITFEGSSVSTLQKAFENPVDDYLDFCEERGEVPEKPFSGRLILRLNPQQHRQIFFSAKQAGKSLNAWMVSKLAQAVKV